MDKTVDGDKSEQKNVADNYWMDNHQMNMLVAEVVAVLRLQMVENLKVVLFGCLKMLVVEYHVVMMDDYL